MKKKISPTKRTFTSDLVNRQYTKEILKHLKL